MSNYGTSLDKLSGETADIHGRRINILRKLGEGGFSKVKLVQDRKYNNEMYAMKEMNRVSIRANMSKLNQSDPVLRALEGFTQLQEVRQATARYCRLAGGAHAK